MIEAGSDKVVSLDDAVRNFIRDGAHISFGGFTVNRVPVACAYEIIRQGITGLHVYMHSGGQALDLLIGAGCVRVVEIAYGANGRFAPTCVRFRKAVERGELLVEDYTNYQMTLRFQAGGMGVPFLPVRSGMGTDIVRRWGFDAEMRRRDTRLPYRKLVVLDDPFAEKEPQPVVLVPAINPDVTVIHAQQADTQGTVRIAGLTFADVEQARAARHVVVTCEELVEPEVLRAEPERNHLPFFLADAVVHAPFGAHPTACYGFYDYDAQHLNNYRALAADDARFAAYLEEYVHGVSDHAKYLEKIGPEALEHIRADSPFGYAQGLTRSPPRSTKSSTTAGNQSPVPRNKNPGYTARELMAIVAAREIRDGEIVFCGTGISLLAAMAAKHIHAPEAVIFFETGAVDPVLHEIPLSVADSRVMCGASFNAGMAEAFAMMQNRFWGPREVGILGAAQIDRYGNLNSTCVGDYENPTVRLPGSGGACDVGSFVGRTIVFIKHERRRFVERLDYLTTPGYLDGPGVRERTGYPSGGPAVVISDKALLRFDAVSKEMYLDRFYPGIKPEEIQAHTGFPIDLSRAAPLDPPNDEELRILRQEVDPQRLILEE